MNFGTIVHLVLLYLILGTAGCGTQSPAKPESRTKNRADLNSADSVLKDEVSGDDDKEDKEEDEDEDDGIEDIEEEVSNDDDEDINDEEADKDSGDLVISAEETEHEDSKIAVRNEGGTWEEFTWPKSGSPITVKGVCRGSKAPLEIRATSENGEAVTMPHPDLGILSQNKNNAKLGYEPTHCSGSKCQDDNIITLECTKGDLEFK